MSKVTIITASYNKGYLLAQAGFSVIRQTSPNWIWWIVLNGADLETEAIALRLADMDTRIKVFEYPANEAERGEVYYPSAIINEYYSKVETPYLAWLSDDDLLAENFVEDLSKALEDDPTKDVVYGHCYTTRNGVAVDAIYAHKVMGKGTGLWPDCVLDGGQILQTKRSHDIINYKLPITWDKAGHIDGVYLNKLAEHFTFWPVNVAAVIHRRTPLSTWRKE